MPQPIVQIDAFADRPFTGNPAAVCIMNQAADETWMQQVAMEINLSETAFLYPIESGYHLRWFTPAVEVPLCGHATLASAHLLFEDSHVPVDRPIRFQTLSGELIARKQGDLIELDFPANPTRPVDPPELLPVAIGVGVVNCERTDRTYLIELESETAVRGLIPDFAAIAKIGDGSMIVTARSEEPDLDFVSRLFAPGFGVNEDPVTGSAHTLLGPYWTQRLGKIEMRAYQASARGGYLSVRVDGDRVYLCGRAITVMRGELI